MRGVGEMLRYGTEWRGNGFDIEERRGGRSRKKEAGRFRRRQCRKAKGQEGRMRGGEAVGRAVGRYRKEEALHCPFFRVS